ncbi:MAG: DUF4321 domain-containing protein [Clostridiales bacterium]
MARYNGSRNPWLLVALLIACGVIGGFIGILLEPVAPWAGKILISLGSSSFTLDLMVLSITLGAALHLNLCSILGFIIAIMIFFRV